MVVNTSFHKFYGKSFSLVKKIQINSKAVRVSVPVLGTVNEPVIWMDPVPRVPRAETNEFSLAPRLPGVEMNEFLACPKGITRYLEAEITESSPVPTWRVVLKVWLNSIRPCETGRNGTRLFMAEPLI